VQKHEGQAASNPLSSANLQKKLIPMMKCPYCEKEIPGKTCPDCGAAVPEESRFCMHCGSAFEQEQENASDNEAAFDLDDRILCPDGTCTGIIIDGKCSECGKPYPEGAPQESEDGEAG
jgi:predicted nucleic acid-binding Zn ribbon protein